MGVNITVFEIYLIRGVSIQSVAANRNIPGSGFRATMEIVFYAVSISGRGAM
jgi:hypothetical protein